MELSQRSHSSPQASAPTMRAVKSSQEPDLRIFLYTEFRSLGLNSGPIVLYFSSVYVDTLQSSKSLQIVAIWPGRLLGLLLLWFGFVDEPKLHFPCKFVEVNVLVDEAVTHFLDLPAIVLDVVFIFLLLSLIAFFDGLSKAREFGVSSGLICLFIEGLQKYVSFPFGWLLKCLRGFCRRNTCRWRHFLNPFRRFNWLLPL